MRSTPSNPWTAIEDDLLVSTGAEELSRLAALLSDQLAAPVVALAVADSDVATILLVLDGVPVQAVQLGPSIKDRTEAIVPSPRWKEVMAPGYAVAELARAWREPVVFVEQALVAMAPALGWDPRLPGRGDWVDPADHAGDIEERTLMLDAVGTTSTGAGSPPALGHGGGDDIVGGRRQDVVGLTVVAHSIGGAGRGLTLVVWGPAVTGGVVVARRATIAVGQPPAPTGGVEFEVEGTAEQRVSFPDLAIPAGVADQRTAFAGVSASEGVRRWMATRVEAVVDVECLRTGADLVHVSLVPEENPAGNAVWSVNVAVD